MCGRIRAELFGHFRSAEARLLAEGARHVAIVVRLAQGRPRSSARVVEGSDLGADRYRKIIHIVVHAPRTPGMFSATTTIARWAAPDWMYPHKCTSPSKMPTFAWMGGNAQRCQEACS